MKKRGKVMPRAKYASIENRFLDVRFSGLEDAINAQDNSKLKGKRKNNKRMITFNLFMVRQVLI